MGLTGARDRDLLSLLLAAGCLLAAATSLAAWACVRRAQEPRRMPTTAEVRATTAEVSAAQAPPVAGRVR